MAKTDGFGRADRMQVSDTAVLWKWRKNQTKTGAMIRGDAGASLSFNGQEVTFLDQLLPALAQG